MLYQKHLNYFLKVLFNEFPRTIGFPWRTDKKEKLDKILSIAYRNHTKNPCFVSLYEDYFDKIWIDFDDKESKNEQLSFNDAKVVYNRLLKDFDVDPKSIFLVYTGSKGFHIYVLNDKYKFGVSIDDDVKLRKLLHLGLSYLTRGLKTVDSPLFADTNRLTRMAGAQRTNGMFTLALDPSKVFGSFENIYEYFKMYRFNFSLIAEESSDFLLDRLKEGYSVRGTEGNTNVLARIVKKAQEVNFETSSEYTSPKFNESLARQIEVAHKSDKEGFSKAVDLVLRASLSKTVYYNIIAPNPSHNTRISATIKLLQAGFTIEDVTQFFSSLGWIDFVYDVTLKNVEYISKKYT